MSSANTASFTSCVTCFIPATRFCFSVLNMLAVYTSVPCVLIVFVAEKFLLCLVYPTFISVLPNNFVLPVTFTESPVLPSFAVSVSVLSVNPPSMLYDPASCVSSLLLYSAVMSVFSFIFIVPSPPISL